MFLCGQQIIIKTISSQTVRLQVCCCWLVAFACPGTCCCGSLGLLPVKFADINPFLTHIQFSIHIPSTFFSLVSLSQPTQTNTRLIITKHNIECGFSYDVTDLCLRHWCTLDSSQVRRKPVDAPYQKRSRNKRARAGVGEGVVVLPCTFKELISSQTYHLNITWQVIDLPQVVFFKWNRARNVARRRLVSLAGIWIRASIFGAKKWLTFLKFRVKHFPDCFYRQTREK